MLYRIKNVELPHKEILKKDYPKIRNALERVDVIFNIEDITILNKDEIQFLNDSRRATTDTTVRLRRTEFIVNLLNSI